MKKAFYILCTLAGSVILGITGVYLAYLKTRPPDIVIESGIMRPAEVKNVTRKCR